MMSPVAWLGRVFPDEDERAHVELCRNQTSEQLQRLPLRWWERWLMWKYPIERENDE